MKLLKKSSQGSVAGHVKRMSKENYKQHLSLFCTFCVRYSNIFQSKLNQYIILELCDTIHTQALACMLCIIMLLTMHTPSGSDSLLLSKLVAVYRDVVKTQNTSLTLLAEPCFYGPWSPITSFFQIPLFCFRLMIVNKHFSNFWHLSISFTPR